jgi:hypothetical protein
MMIPLRSKTFEQAVPEQVCQFLGSPLLALIKNIMEPLKSIFTKPSPKGYYYF